MELRHLRYMLAVAEHRSFTRAALAVHISQSTLSHQIRQLEHEIGHALFDRSGREVTLTEAGEALLPGVRRALQELNGAIRALKQLDEGQTITLSVLVGSRGCARRVLPPVLAPAGDDSQPVAVQIEEVHASAMAERLRIAGADFEIVLGDVENVPAGWVFEPLYREEIGLLVPKSHRFANRRQVKMVELHGEAIALPAAPEPTRLALDRCLEQVQAKPRVLAEFNLVVTLFEMAALTDAAIIGPYNMRPSLPNLTFVSLEDPAPERTIGFMWRDPASASRQVRTIAERIRKRVQAIIFANDGSFVIRPCPPNPPPHQLGALRAESAAGGHPAEARSPSVS